MRTAVPDGNLKLLKQHMDAEKTLGAEIHPAARKQSFTSEGRADDDCKPVIHISRRTSYLRNDSVQATRNRQGSKSISVWR